MKIVSCTIELRYLSDAVVFQNSILGLSNLWQLFQCNRCVECLGNTLWRCDLNNSSVSSFYHKLHSISNAERVLQKPLSICLKISRVLLPFQVVALCAVLRMEPCRNHTIDPDIQVFVLYCRTEFLGRIEPPSAQQTEKICRLLKY